MAENEEGGARIRGPLFAEQQSESLGAKKVVRRRGMDPVILIVIGLFLMFPATLLIQVDGLAFAGAFIGAIAGAVILVGSVGQGVLMGMRRFHGR